MNPRRATAGDGYFDDLWKEMRNRVSLEFINALGPKMRIVTNMPTMTHWKTAAIAAAAAAVFTVSTARAETKTYIACNQWNECWKVKEHITHYPADVHVIYRDEAWWDQHQHDTQWRELPDPSDDNGWYDKDGVWHAFETTTPPPP